MLGAGRKTRLVFLAAGDLLAAASALAAALLLRYGRAEFAVQWQAHARPFAYVFLLWLVVFFIVGLYEFDELRDRMELLSRTGEGLAAAVAVSLAVFYVVPFFGIEPKTNLALTTLLFAALFVGWRLLTMHLFSRARLRSRVLFLGDDPETIELCAALNANPHLGFTCLASTIDAAALPESDLIVVSHRLSGRQELTGTLYRKFIQATAVIDLPTFYERVRRSVPASVLDERWVLENLATQDNAVYEHLKRLFDAVFAAVLLAPAGLLMLPIALVIRLDDGAPVLFRQRRVGRGGRPFEILKFRTMRVDAEKDGATFAREGDPRVTRVGRFLRASRLDELPQLWNILRGDMSFVGPRPERPEIEEELSRSISLFPVRHLVRPGLTGWAQINAPYAATLDDHLKKLRLDLYYLKHRSLTLDAAIVLKTIYSVFKRRGQ
jgi:exopolysaccharide biosynthesis polyprenyl glycosylphosphotransferase